MRKANTARASTSDLWGAHRSLWGLLLLGVIVLVLAAIAPQAWATPDQNPLQQTNPPPPPAGSISGIVFRDLDSDGSLDPGEPGIPGVTVTLDGTDTDISNQDTGDPDQPEGGYWFPDLDPGSRHTVSAEDTPNYVILTAPQVVDMPDPAEAEGEQVHFAARGRYQIFMTIISKNYAF